MPRQEGLNKLGSFTVKSGRLCAFDPYCHGVDVEIDNVVRGTWDAYTHDRSQDSWGVRPCDLTVVLAGQEPDALVFHERVGTVCVDAATAGVYDLGGYDGREELSELADQRVCEVGACSLSGFGDGCFDTWVARNADGKVIGVQIVFIEDEYDIRYLAEREGIEAYDED